MGSGIMGAGIAEVAAASGHVVVLRSRSPASGEAAMASIQGSLDRQVAKGRRTDDERREILERIALTTDLGALADLDLVIESVVEDLPVKKALFAELGSSCRPGTLLATNTSTFPIVDLAVASGRPDRVCGMHFFNPATALPLVELIRPVTASEPTMAAARCFVDELGKEVVEVRDQAGFVVNALLFPYLNHAVRLFESGAASKEDIDAAMKGGCAYPMGPFNLLDLVGLDTSLAILDALYDEFREPGYAPAPLLRRLVAAGRLGRKSGSGFYDYSGS